MRKIYVGILVMMLRSYWIIAIAIAFGSVLAVPTIALAQVAVPKERPTENTPLGKLDESAAQAQERQSGREGSEVANEAPFSESSAGKQDGAAMASEETTRNSQDYPALDLNEQKRMAEATEGLLDLTWLQILVSSIETALFLVTIGLTLWTVSITRRTAQKELRAYVAIWSGRIESIVQQNGNQLLLVTVELKNSGQTPGNSFETQIFWHLLDSNANAPYPDPMPGRGGLGSSIIGPGTLAHLDVLVPISPADLAAIRQKQKKLYIWGTAHYEDVFAKQRYYHFRSVNGDEGPQTGIWPLSSHPSGHSAN